MSAQLGYSMFQDVLFPPDQQAGSRNVEDLTLRRLKRYVPPPELNVLETDIVVFDLETTGLDPDADRIIEVGAIRLRGLEPAGEFSTLVQSEIPLTEDIVRLTGITPEMLEGQPAVEGVLKDFLDFIEGAVLVAHNAEFDLSMIRAAYSRMGIDLEWPTFCTLKMARALLPDLENKKLDTLAEHYGLSFESRHRSIGDVKVTCGVLTGMLGAEGAGLSRWDQFADYSII